jgi:hypothetical protein
MSDLFGVAQKKLADEFALDAPFTWVVPSAGAGGDDLVSGPVGDNRTRGSILPHLLDPETRSGRMIAIPQ